MDKEINNIIKNAVIYFLKQHGYKVQKNFVREAGTMKKWYAGFWTKREITEAYCVSEFICAAERLSYIAFDNYNVKTIKVGDVGYDVVYHRDIGSYWINVYVEFGE